MDIKKVTETPMDIHTKRKMKLHVKSEKVDKEHKEREKSQTAEKEKGSQEKTAKSKNKEKPQKKPGRKNEIRKRMMQQFLLRRHQEEEQIDIDKILKDMVRIRVSGMAKAAIGYIALGFGSLLVAVVLLAVPIIAVIALIYNSPFAVFFPSVSTSETTQEVLSGYLEEFRTSIDAELGNHNDCDESELIYADFEGTGTTDNYTDILAVYMVKFGVGNMATDMTDIAKRNLKSVYEDMCDYSVSYRIEKIPNEKGKLVDWEIKEVNVTMKTYSDMITEYGFQTEEQELLVEFMEASTMD